MAVPRDAQRWAEHRLVLDEGRSLLGRGWAWPYTGSVIRGFLSARRVGRGPGGRTTARCPRDLPSEWVHAHGLLLNGQGQRPTGPQAGAGATRRSPHPGFVRPHASLEETSGCREKVCGVCLAGTLQPAPRAAGPAPRPAPRAACPAPAGSPRRLSREAPAGSGHLPDGRAAFAVSPLALAAALRRRRASEGAFLWPVSTSRAEAPGGLHWSPASPASSLSSRAPC